jgi:hypothetical protein
MSGSESIRSWKDRLSRLGLEFRKSHARTPPRNANFTFIIINTYREVEDKLRECEKNANPENDAQIREEYKKATE